MRGIRAAASLLAIACMSALLSSCLPRMARQPSVRPFERQMPDMPTGTVPVGGTVELPAADAESPLRATPDVIEEGELYYGYYCLMCHGADGRGRTPVGEAYDPAPADLAGQDVRNMADGELCRAMLTGVGHDPVMESTVTPERRWQIVAYVRELAE